MTFIQLLTFCIVSLFVCASSFEVIHRYHNFDRQILLETSSTLKYGLYSEHSNSSMDSYNSRVTSDCVAKENRMALKVNGKSLLREGQIESIPYPYMAAVLWDGNALLCAGSVISHWHILTAAQCVIITVTGEQREAHRISVRVGSRFGQSGGLVYRVRKWYVPPNYVRKSKANDLAILELKNYMEFSDQVSQILLASYVDTLTLSRYVRNETPCMLLRWLRIASNPSEFTSYGKLNSGDKDSLDLETVYLLHWNDCIDRASKYNQQIDANIDVCTSSSVGQGMCKGDPGDPLVCDGKQYGVASKAVGCNSMYEIDIYTRVDVFHEFIVETMNRRDEELRSGQEKYNILGASSSTAYLSCFNFLIILLIVLDYFSHTFTRLHVRILLQD